MCACRAIVWCVPCVQRVPPKLVVQRASCVGVCAVRAGAWLCVFVGVRVSVGWLALLVGLPGLRPFGSSLSVCWLEMLPNVCWFLVGRLVGGRSVVWYVCWLVGMRNFTSQFVC